MGGFPHVVSLPGSYVLTSDLRVTDPTVDGITVDANNVSIDLNGFSIQGPVQCSGSGNSVVCAPSGAGSDGSGIRALGSSRFVAVRNGFVSGFGGGGIGLGIGRITDVTVRSNATIGISIFNHGLVRDSKAIRNQVNGINVRGTVENCSAEDNGAGIVMSSGLASGNTLRRNGTGISGFRSLLHDNSLIDNTVGIDLVTGGSYVFENRLEGGSIGIRASAGAGNRIERNLISAPIVGIRTTNSTSNLTLTNSVHNAADPYDFSSQDNFGPGQGLDPGETPNSNPWTNFAD